MKRLLFFVSDPVTIALCAVILCAVCITCVRSDEPPPPNSPIPLQSTNYSTPLPPRTARQPALIIYDAHVAMIDGKVWVVLPERYLKDFTNIYHAQLAAKIILPVPLEP